MAAIVIRIRVLGGTAVLIAAMASCIVLTEPDSGPLSMARVDALGDTVPVFPTLRIAFSAALADTVVGIRVTPSLEAGYLVRLCPSRDTLIFEAVEPLRGATRYVLRLAGRVMSGDGSYIDPEDDSIVFVTLPIEVEPNNTTGTADSMAGVICGIIAPANDTDFYYLGRGAWRYLVLTIYDSPCGYGMIGRTGMRFGEGRTRSVADTIAIRTPVDTARHVYVVSATPTARDRYVLRGVP